MSRLRPNILVSGTPGVGKSLMAKHLEEKLGLKAINVGQFAKDKARGYTGKKLEENIQCEIFQTILEEARESYKEELVVELPSNTEEDMTSNMSRMESWVTQWMTDREKRFPRIMATINDEAVKKLETKAVAAEKLIQLLKSQIGEIKAAQSGLKKAEYAKEAEALKIENIKLKEEVELWKKKLTQAEIANGKVVFSSGPEKPVKENCIIPKSEPAETVTKEEPVKKEKKAKAEKAPKEKKPAEDEAPVDIGRLDLRVGHIRSAKKHPDADSLYVEEVDVGEEKPRTVISGLVKFIPEPEMQNRMAIILCNLKPSKMRGIMSEAMVMCASTPEKVEIMAPPEGAKPGDVVEVAGYTRAPDAQLNPKKKIFEAVAPDLKVNSAHEATYKGVIWTVNGSPVTSQTLVSVNIK